MSKKPNIAIIGAASGLRSFLGKAFDA